MELDTSNEPCSREEKDHVSATKLKNAKAPPHSVVARAAEHKDDDDDDADGDEADGSGAN